MSAIEKWGEFLNAECDGAGPHAIHAASMSVPAASEVQPRCGESTMGRQWHNQDIGFGLCPVCWDRIATHRPFDHEPMSAEEMERTYGKRGVHVGPFNDETAAAASEVRS